MNIKKALFNAILVSGLVILAGCNSSSSANELYVQEQPLQVDFISSGEYEKIGKQKIIFDIRQGDKQAEDLQFVHLSVWNEQKSLNLSMSEVQKEQNGQYSLNINFPSEGLYYAQIHTGNEDQVITPTKRLIVGDLSDADIATLQSGTKPNTGETGHHH